MPNPSIRHGVERLPNHPPKFYRFDCPWGYNRQNLANWLHASPATRSQVPATIARYHASKAGAHWQPEGTPDEGRQVLVIPPGSRNPDVPEALSDLTPAQLRVLAHLATNRYPSFSTVEETAVELGIALGTLNNHLYHIYRKMAKRDEKGFSNRSRAVHDYRRAMGLKI